MNFHMRLPVYPYFNVETSCRVTRNLKASYYCYCCNYHYLFLQPLLVPSVTFLLSLSSTFILHMLDALKVLFILTGASTYLGIIEITFFILYLRQKKGGKIFPSFTCI